MPKCRSCFAGSGGHALRAKVVQTEPYLTQNLGIYGLKKPMNYFYEPNYLENFIECVLNVYGIDMLKAVLLIGGDGRNYSKDAIRTIIQMCPAHKVAKVILGKDGLLSTPAASYLIYKYKAVCGIILTASTAHAGNSSYFGIKINGSDGGPAPDAILNKIELQTKKITQYRICKDVNPDITLVTTQQYTTDYGHFTVDIVDPVKDYMTMMKSVFNFPAIKRIMHGLDQKPKFRVKIDCMNGVMGLYVKRIMCEEFSMSEEDIVRAEPLPDFGGIDPNPFLVSPVEFADIMRQGGYDMGITFDADGVRQRILSESGTVIDPCDSLAVIAANIECVPFYAAKGIKGFARSVATSTAIDRVAMYKAKPLYVVPPDIRYVNALADSGMLTMWGDELVGIGSTHIRENDAMWVLLAWLSILAELDQSVDATMKQHWTMFGRSYYGRCDFNQMSHDTALAVLHHFAMFVKDKSIVNKIYTMSGSSWYKSSRTFTVESVDNMVYRNPLTEKTVKNLGVLVTMTDGTRVIIRECEYPMRGLDIHIYVEDIEEDVSKIYEDPMDRVGTLMDLANEISNIQDLSGWGLPNWTYISGEQGIKEPQESVVKTFGSYLNKVVGYDEGARDSTTWRTVAALNASRDFIQKPSRSSTALNSQISLPAISSASGSEEVLRRRSHSSLGISNLSKKTFVLQDARKKTYASEGCNTEKRRHHSKKENMIDAKEDARKKTYTSEGCNTDARKKTDI